MISKQFFYETPETKELQNDLIHKQQAVRILSIVGEFWEKKDIEINDFFFSNNRLSLKSTKG